MTKDPTPPEALTLAQAEHTALAADLGKMRDTLAAHEAQLTTERRKSGPAARQAELAQTVAGLRELVAGQEADVAEAEANLTNLRAALEREAASERYRKERSTYQGARLEADEILGEIFAAAEAGVKRYAEVVARAQAAVGQHPNVSDLRTFPHPRFDGYAHHRTDFLRAAWKLYGEPR